MPRAAKKSKPEKRAKRDGVRVGTVFVPIYKIHDGRVQIAYPSAGKRKIDTFKTRAAAKAAAETIATQLNNSGSEAFIFTARDRAIYSQAIATGEKFSMGVDDAMAEWAAAREKAGKHRLSKIIDLGLQSLVNFEKTTSQVLEDLLTSKRASDLNSRYMRGLEDDLAEFVKAHPGNIGNVRAGEIEVWLNGLDVGARRRNNIRAEVVTLFRFAKERGYLLESRRTEAEKVGRINDRRAGAVSTYTPEELQKLLDTLSLGSPAKDSGEKPQPSRLEWLPWVAIGGLAGIRTEEICPPTGSSKDQLRWEDFKWAKRLIDIRPEVSKTGERRLVPICDALFAWLKPWHAAEGPVCLHRRPDRITAWLSKASGVKWKINALRHSYGTYRMAVTKNMPALSYEMGNSISMIRRHYHEARPESDGIAWFAVWPEWPANVIQTTFQLAI